MSSWIPPKFDSMPPLKKLKSKPKSDFQLKSSKSVLKNSYSFTKNVENWIENFHPQTVSDLAVHSKKIQEVKDWINDSRENSKKNKILLITGPTGSGKTATVKVLCKELGLTLSEWINPMDFVRMEQGSYRQDYHNIEKQSNLFIEFIIKASRYKSLFDENCKGRIVLVEDYPNYLLKDPVSIQTVLSKFTAHGMSPLIFICTDSTGEKINIGKNLFTDSIRQQFQIHHISFNPVSVTGLKSALVRALNIMPELTECVMKYNPPNAEIMDAIIQSALGDIRSALNNLLFSTMNENTGKIIEIEPVFEQLPWTLMTPRGSKKTRPAKQKCTKLKNFGRDDSLNLLHGVGRVLNPKRIMCDMSYKFTHGVEETSDSFMSMHKVFLNFLHHNYLTHFQCIDDITPAAEYLSFADVLSSDFLEIDSPAYTLWLSIAALQVFNLEPVKIWAPIKAPYKVELKIPGCDELHLSLNHAARRRVLAMDYKTYCGILNAKQVHSKVENFEDEDIIIEEFFD